VRWETNAPPVVERRRWLFSIKLCHLYAGQSFYLTHKFVLSELINLKLAVMGVGRQGVLGNRRAFPCEKGAGFGVKPGRLAFDFRKAHLVSFSWYGKEY